MIQEMVQNEWDTHKSIALPLGHAGFNGQSPNSFVIDHEPSAKR